MDDMRFSGAMIYARDFSKMQAFYRDVLQLKPMEETATDTWVEFDTGSTRLALHAIPVQIADGIEISLPPQPRETNPVKLSFAVEDIAFENKRLESLGVTVVRRPWGSYDAMDPEGNIFAIVSHTPRH